jgi:prephenate dehydrogenase
MSAFHSQGRGHLDGPVVVLGTGLLGTSIGLGLRGRGVPVFLSDPSPTNQAVAVDIGAGRPLAELGDAVPQLVVVAAPPDVTADVVAKALSDYPGSVVVDIASVKAEILERLRRRGADLSRYVGTHPMAGREKSGPVAARGELFTSMPWVVCPSEETSGSALQAARSLALDLGAVVSQFTADEHDEAVALVSHLPQVMSSLLASRLQGTPLHALSLAGNGLRDVTRIAASDPSLWVQILGGNAAKVVGILYGVRDDLNQAWRTAAGVFLADSPGGRQARTDRPAPHGNRRDRRQPRGPPPGPLLRTKRRYGGNLRVAEQA